MLNIEANENHATSRFQNVAVELDEIDVGPLNPESPKNQDLPCQELPAETVRGSATHRGTNDQNLRPSEV